MIVYSSMNIRNYSCVQNSANSLSVLLSTKAVDDTMHGVMNYLKCFINYFKK